MNRYVKESSRLTVKFLQESNTEIILEVPTTALELHEYFKPDYVTSVLRNTFGEAKLKSIGNVVIVVDQRFVLQQA